MSTVHILHELAGSYSSKVELVEVDGERYVLKTWSTEETQNEKLFLQELAANGLPSLRVIDHPEIQPNQILLEYIDGSPKINGSPESFFELGKSVRKLHEIRYDSCFKVNDAGEKINIPWTDFLKQTLEYGVARQSERKTDIDANVVRAIQEYVLQRLPIQTDQYTILHTDIHNDNVMLKNGELVFFDKNSEIFSGDPIYDLMTILCNHPNGTYIETSDPRNARDKEIVTNFFAGYGSDILSECKEKCDLYLVIKALERHPNPWEMHLKEILQNIVLK